MYRLWITPLDGSKGWWFGSGEPGGPVKYDDDVKAAEHADIVRKAYLDVRVDVIYTGKRNVRRSR